jgi:hypothetical protein
MKLFIFLILNFIFLVGYSQNQSFLDFIDSRIIKDKNNVSTVFKTDKKNNIWATHGKNFTDISSIFTIGSNKSLLSASEILYSPGDTSLITNYYFDNSALIKVESTDIDINNIRHVDIFYFSKDKWLNVEEIKGRYSVERHLEHGNEILKKFTKKRVNVFDL